MGWTSYHTTRQQLIADRIRTQTLTDKETGSVLKEWRTLRHCIRGSNLYKVTAICDGEGNEITRFIAVDMLASFGEGQQGYKDLDETCGPCTYSCPSSYFDLVPLDTYYEKGTSQYETVKNWRQACLDAQAARSKPPTVPPKWSIGTRFEVPEERAISFGGNTPTSKFEYRGKYRRTSQVLVLCLNGSNSGCLGRIRNKVWDSLIKHVLEPTVSL